MAKGTPATVMLDKAGLAYAFHEYAYDPDADRVGLQAAAALGADPGQVFKTLLVLVDGKPACAIVASNREVAMKRLAAALGAKAAQMMVPAEAERLTGYKVGGISPLGQRRALPTVLDAGALACAQIYVNGGRRGLQVLLAPDDLVRLCGAKVAEIAA